MHNKLFDVQLLLVRLCIGVDFFPYAVQHLLLSDALSPIGYFVGSCTLLAGIGLTLGIMTRLTSLLSALFLIAALFIGGHDHVGFFWYLPGGGWEFLAFWASLCLSFIITGGGRYRIDTILRQCSTPIKYLFI